MINHHIHAALAHERASAFLTEAQAFRQARQARPARPHAGASAADVTAPGLLTRWLRPGWRRLPAPSAAARGGGNAGRGGGDAWRLATAQRC